MMNFRHAPTIAVLILCCWMLEGTTEAYQYSSLVQKLSTSSSSALNSWALPTPDMSFLTQSWYDEYNPTARKMVYEDSFLDSTTTLSFGDLLDDVTPDEDRLLSMAPPPTPETRRRRRSRNPLRLAGRWAQRRWKS